jgi:transmembrane sensor
MSQSNAEIREAIAEQASEWFIENRRGILDGEASASFMAWLQTSPVHVEVYLRIAALAPDFEAAAKATTIPLETLLARAQADNVRSLDWQVPKRPPDRAGPRRSRLWSLAAVAAAAIVFVASATIWSMRDGERFGLSRTYRTAYGEQRDQPLPDGSVLHLNMDSEVTVRYTRGERVVSVDRGQALFEVAQQGARRFRVQAGPAGIIAVGTQFDVYRHSGAVRITVIEGTVAVFAGPSPPPVSADRLATNSVRLSAGDQLDVSDRIGAPRHVDARVAVAWLQRQIAFDDQPLGEVAAEFNRYGRIPLEVEDEALRALPISGAFDAFDTDSFAAFLAKLDGVVVQRMPTRIRVLTLATAEREQHSRTP